MAMAMTMMIVMMVMRMMTRTTTIARLTTMMVVTVMMNLFRRNNRERVDRVRVDITYWATCDESVHGRSAKCAEAVASPNARSQDPTCDESVHEGVGS